MSVYIFLFNEHVLVRVGIKGELRAKFSPFLGGPGNHGNHCQG